ncbi:MAG: hypothetical protein HZA92_00485 [Verrucomicrobia bacterium]|nr:hypothetical protein [Verrucomicrobiota bacterium]
MSHAWSKFFHTDLFLALDGQAAALRDISAQLNREKTPGEKPTAPLDKAALARLEPDLKELFALAQSLPDLTQEKFARALEVFATKLRRNDAVGARRSRRSKLGRKSTFGIQFAWGCFCGLKAELPLRFVPNGVRSAR